MVLERMTGVYDRDGRMICVGDRIRIDLKSPHTKTEYWYPEYEVVFKAPQFELRHVGGDKDSDTARWYFRVPQPSSTAKIETIRALAPIDGLALVQELRAERDAASSVAATAYGATLDWEQILEDDALWQAQDDIAKSRVACMTAESDRDRLAAANAALEAKVAGLVEALRNLVGPDCMYDGRNIVITAVNHGDAIRLVAEARAALATQEAGT